MLALVALTFVIHLAKADIVSPENNSKYKISTVMMPNNRQKPAVFKHGESPVWDPKSQSLYFVDVNSQNVHRLVYNTGKIETKHIDYGEVNIVSLVGGSARLLVGVRASLFLMDWKVPGDAALRLLTTVDIGWPSNVLNEGKSDKHGRFWTGTKGPQTGDNVTPDKATFYSIEQNKLKHPNVQLKPVSISNGLVWSLNDSVLYYNDSPTQKVEAFDFDLAEGTISGRRTIVDITEHGYVEAIPDGMTIDSNGNLWVALMFGGAVLHIDPNARKIISVYKIPTLRVTSVAWGGPKLNELFVTTGQDEHDDSSDPLAGVIFILKNTGYRGVNSYKFRFDNADQY